MGVCCRVGQGPAIAMPINCPPPPTPRPQEWDRPPAIRGGVERPCSLSSDQLHISSVAIVLAPPTPGERCETPVASCARLRSPYCWSDVSTCPSRSSCRRQHCSGGVGVVLNRPERAIQFRRVPDGLPDASPMSVRPSGPSNLCRHRVRRSSTARYSRLRRFRHSSWPLTPRDSDMDGCRVGWWCLRRRCGVGSLCGSYHLIVDRLRVVCHG